MLIQFKKIRNALIKEGKLGKYILYAIGEIFLVVAGILIALQVNNYDLKQQKKSIEQLREMVNLGVEPSNFLNDLLEIINLIF